MRIEENWALPIGRIAAFLRMLPGAEEETEKRFFVGDCRVTLAETEPSGLAGVTIARTLVCFEGEGDALKNLHRRFQIQFLSAGG